MPANALGRRPVPVVLAGALAIAFSGILYRYADVSPTTGAFFRCAWALAPLWLLIALLIKLDSRGPIFYKQERVGMDGRLRERRHVPRSDLPVLDPARTYEHDFAAVDGTDGDEFLRHGDPVLAWWMSEAAVFR